MMFLDKYLLIKIVIVINEVKKLYILLSFYLQYKKTCGTI